MDGRAIRGYYPIGPETGANQAPPQSGSRKPRMPHARQEDRNMTDPAQAATPEPPTAAQPDNSLLVIGSWEPDKNGESALLFIGS
jgi:hypothetical protein